MELGAFFHDDLFEEARDKTQKAAPISYNAKICTPQVGMTTVGVVGIVELPQPYREVWYWYDCHHSKQAGR